MCPTWHNFNMVRHYSMPFRHLHLRVKPQPSTASGAEKPCVVHPCRAACLEVLVVEATNATGGGFASETWVLAERWDATSENGEPLSQQKCGLG